MPSFSFPFSSPFGSGFSFTPPSGGSSLDVLGPTGPNNLSTGMDQLIDPVTRSYVRTSNGEWAETADARTTILIALSIELETSPYDPGHGSAVPERMRSGDIGADDLIDFVQNDYVRILNDLVDEGIIASPQVQVRDPQTGKPLVSGDGRLLVRITAFDLASGSPIVPLETTV